MNNTKVCIADGMASLSLSTDNVTVTIKFLFIYVQDWHS